MAFAVLLFAFKTLADDKQLIKPYEAIYKPNPPSEPVLLHVSGKSQGMVGTAHSIRATKAISEETLRQYLESKQSPLANYSGAIARSPYSSLIIGICTIEEYGCTHYPSNNMGGLMSGGHLIQFDSLADWINAENRFLERAEANHPTIESLNCWYVVPCSSNWLNTVIKTKQEVENLGG